MSIIINKLKHIHRLEGCAKFDKKLDNEAALNLPFKNLKENCMETLIHIAIDTDYQK